MILDQRFAEPDFSAQKLAAAVGLSARYPSVDPNLCCPNSLYPKPNSPFFSVGPGGGNIFLAGAGETRMERFIHNENIRRYRRLLEEEQDEEKRNTIRKLLAEDEAKEITPGLERQQDRPKQP